MILKIVNKFDKVLIKINQFRDQLQLHHRNCHFSSNITHDDIWQYRPQERHFGIKHLLPRFIKL